MSDTPDISFVIPVFNMESYIGEAISSCLAQSHRNIEVVVVDDGSTDATPKVIKHYADGDPRVKPLRVPNGGAGAARNIGCQAASAPLVALLDADDLCDKDRAKKTLELHKANPDAYLSGAAALIDAFNNQKGQVVPDPFVLERALKENMNGIVNSTVAFTKSLWEKFKYEEGELARIGIDDWQQQLRCALAGVKFVSTPKVLSAYRMLQTGISKHRNEERVKELKAAFLKESGVYAEAA